MSQENIEFETLFVKLGEEKGYKFTKEQVEAATNLEKFCQMAAQDQELQEKMKAAIDPETFLKLVVELGEEKGYRFTKEQVEAATAKAQLQTEAEAELWSELSEEQLETVGGGRSIWGVCVSSPTCGVGCYFLTIAATGGCCAWR